MTSRGLYGASITHTLGLHYNAWKLYQAKWWNNDWSLAFMSDHKQLKMRLVISSLEVEKEQSDLKRPLPMTVFDNYQFSC